MQHAVILRDTTSDHGTFGRLFTPDGTEFQTLELPWRDNRSNLSCIPVGKYETRHLERSASGRYRDVYHLLSVDRRTGILMHAGNYAGDRTKGLQTHSHGCILIGMKRGVLGTQRAVLGSKTGLRRFVSKMNREPFILHIIDTGVSHGNIT